MDRPANRESTTWFRLVVSDRPSQIHQSRYAAANTSNRGQAGLVIPSGLIATRSDRGSARGRRSLQATFGPFDRP
jgi:hypothetical protein